LDNYYPLIKQYNSIAYQENFLTAEEIKFILETLDISKLEYALVGNDIKNNSVRKSNTIFFEDYDKYDWLYSKVSSYISYINSTNYNHILYGIQPLQYSEYDSSYAGFYSVHKDSEDTAIGLKRILSFSIQLVDYTDYIGGDLVIQKDNHKITSKKEKGSITVFPSEFLHEVTPVTSGFRKSLVGWVVGPRL
jgi:PKHD-type hydroxylase